jgi:predicted Zn-ribbon and HTH transcriptional regulator
MPSATNGYTGALGLATSKYASPLGKPASLRISDGSKANTILEHLANGSTAIATTDQITNGGTSMATKEQIAAALAEKNLNAGAQLILEQNKALQKEVEEHTVRLAHTASSAENTHQVSSVPCLQKCKYSHTIAPYLDPRSCCKGVLCL